MKKWIGPYTPTRMPADGNTYLLHTLQGSPPFADQGTSGLPLQDVSGLGTGYQVGVRGPIFGEDALYLDDNIQPGGVRADGTSPPVLTGLTFSVWVTISSWIQGGNQGMVWVKSYFPTSWTAPYLWGLTFDSGVLKFYYATDGVLKSLDVGQDLIAPLYTPHLLGATYDGANVKTWADGKEVASAAETGAFTMGTGPWMIGPHNAGGTPPLGGIGGGSSCNKIGGIIEEVRFDTVARGQAWWTENWERGMGIIP